MNVLLFVTTLIMALSMLTYARLQLYRNFSVLQTQFNQYMTKTERGYINSRAVWWYENSRSETRRGVARPKNPASSRLSFIVFIDRAKQAQFAAAFPKLHLLAKKLIFYLYKDQPFYKHFEQLRPDIVDAFLAGLIVADNLPKDQKIKNAEDLAGLDLGDPLLNSFAYYVFKGSVVPEKEQMENRETPPTSLLSQMTNQANVNAETDDENGDSNRKEEYRSPEGYQSLLDDIVVSDTIKIRVFLAPKTLLMAIFDDPNIVNGVIEMRNNLYRNVINGTMSPADASTQFLNSISPRSDPNFDQTILDYSVTKTNPKNYE